MAIRCRRHDSEGLTHLFPAPARIAVADLAALGMPGARARSASALAQIIADDPLIFSRGASLEDAIAKLRALPGIGEWTAQYIAMRELREPDAFPAADIGLLRAMAAPDGRQPSPAELLDRAERWRPWRAYAALHLWAAGTVGYTGTDRCARSRLKFFVSTGWQRRSAPRCW